ncbi:hypothetical protein DFH08DRAFT_954742 [Mycena albidolilacea]|uniref:Uncharacterized protein n=1 Tax=Mycena albidolilacea TaxID=1033008 RepID=A0AAD7ACM1_9AGAR|nr:hypothetical protein DFH08DRAFT_954742 [Mycena albidolilacea]
MSLIPPEAAAPLLPNKSLQMQPGASVIQVMVLYHLQIHTKVHGREARGALLHLLLHLFKPCNLFLRRPLIKHPAINMSLNHRLPVVPWQTAFFSHLNTQILMASPGPRLRDQGDSESEDDDPEHINLEMETEPATSPPPRHPGPSRRNTHIQPFAQANKAAVPQQQGHSGSNLDRWNSYDVDDKNFAWASDTVLKANTRSADCQAFFGEHIEH